MADIAATEAPLKAASSANISAEDVPCICDRTSKIRFLTAELSAINII